MTDTSQDIIAPKDFFPFGDAHIEGWPDGVLVAMQAQVVGMGDIEFVIVVAAPPGKLREDLFLTLPKA